MLEILWKINKKSINLLKLSNFYVIFYTMKDKYVRFCENVVRYTIDGNEKSVKGKAYIDAGFKVKDIKTACAAASRLLKREDIQEKIQEISKALKKDTIMEAQEILQWLTNVVRLDSTDIFDEEGNIKNPDALKIMGKYIQGIEYKKTKYTEEKKIKFVGKIDAITALAKYHRLIFESSTNIKMEKPTIIVSDKFFPHIEKDQEDQEIKENGNQSQSDS